MHFTGRNAGISVARDWLALGCVLLGLAAPLKGAELAEVRDHLLGGRYAECVRLSEAALREPEAEEEWRLLLIQAQMATGRYTNALAVVEAGLDRHAQSVRLRLLGREVFLQNGRRDRAQAMLSEINSLGSYRMWAYQDAANLVALGRAVLLLGADPRRVLEQFFDRAKKNNPSEREVYLASGAVALDKNDFALAAKVFADGLKKFPKDADMHCGLARAYAPSDRRVMLASLETALSHNTNHVPSFLLLADHLIDGEDYEAANKTLDQALAVNPWHPEAWAYRAVIEHLRGRTSGETVARQAARLFWDSNPAVDHLIGRKLSQKYRFAEGAACQRRALQFDAKFLPAKSQLAQDLLRLGEEQEGWNLVAEVHRDDGYDVTAYNLVGLQESMDKYRTLTNRDFIVRMSAHEAAVYGDQVLELLQRAKEHLCAKYDFKLDKPTIVEIFADQKDFGVRTFGMPGNPGFLGVCFGSVITANSPASQAGHPANWQAVLWHEFCHVVTLQLTRNKMPRWLSEGISVHEELQANPVWGQRMNPKYREMTLGKELTPVGELSAAFLTPRTDLHLQFAYYESALVVEYLVKQFGMGSLKNILTDLGNGVDINAAIEKNTAPLAKIETGFAAFARERAEKLAPELDWEKPKPGEAAGSDAELPGQSSKNFYRLTERAKKLFRDKQYKEAKAPLERLIKFYPDHTGADNAYALLAEVHRALGETNLERQVLVKLAALDADALDAFSRLMELDSAAERWPAVVENADRHLAVNPLSAQPYRHLARAQDALGQTIPAIKAYQTMLLLDPPDPADAHFRLARLLRPSDDASAKRHVLQALEEAPRFRDAHRLLLEISRAKETGDGAGRLPDRVTAPSAKTPKP